jgi:hypothetical protein
MLTVMTLQEWAAVTSLVLFVAGLIVVVALLVRS